MSPIQVNIRMATLQDAEVIAEISRQTFHETFAPSNSSKNMDKFMNTQFSKEKLIGEVADPANTFLLAMIDQQLVGYAKVTQSTGPDGLEEEKEIEIARIYCLRQAIGKGVGKALMQACLEFAKSLKKESVWLGVWEHNHTAIDFYRRFGFEKFDEHVFQLGDDPQTDWLMKKKIL
jgi:ribosomal protein S18 acetylase RimI-like enzyme